jgi:hypothetical protein
MTHLEKHCEALGLSSMIIRSERFPPGVGNCLPASVGGVQILKKRKIEARVLVCSMIAKNYDIPAMAFVGHSAETAYGIAKGMPEFEVPPFDDFKKGFPEHSEKEPPFHMVIEAKHAGKRIIVDLTSGQGNNASGLKVPPFLWVVTDKGLPTVRFEDGTYADYNDRPFPPSAPLPDFKNYKLPENWIADWNVLMDVALHCELDPRRFMFEVTKMKAMGMGKPLKG